MKQVNKSGAKGHKNRRCISITPRYLRFQRNAGTDDPKTTQTASLKKEFQPTTESAASPLEELGRFEGLI
jgi:hypothetical protein